LFAALVACFGSSIALGAAAQPIQPAQPQPAPPAPATQPVPGEQPGQAGPIAGQPTPPNQPTGAPPQPSRSPGEAPLPPGTEERAELDYDGRADEGPSAGEVLLWVPRVVFFPVWLVSEFIIRRPLGFLTVWIEQQDAIKFLQDFFTFGPNNNIGVVPTALLDFGFRFSVGLYHFWDDFLFPGNAFRVHAATGGPDWLRLTVADRIPVDENAFFKLRFEASRRPDFLFHGIGPESRKEDASIYKADWLDGSASFNAKLSEANTFEIYNAVRAVEFDPHCCEGQTEAPILGNRVFYGVLDEPPGIEGYTAYRQGVRLALDSRKARPASGTGVRLDVGAEHVIDMQRPGESRWVRYGATFGGFLDIYKERVISLSVTTSFADPLDDRPVPFTELVQLGGDQPMRGFRPGRLMGQSAAVGTFEYRYPIWAILDGSFQLSVGNVFGEHLEGFDPDLFRLSFAGGIRTVGERDTSFDILVGSGTETFADGAELNSLRLVIGTTRHF
jgi:hypothetical protein